MKIDFKTIHLSKRFPLAISRGIHSASDNLFIKLDSNGLFGLGEMSPGNSEGAETASHGQHSLNKFIHDASLKDEVDGMTIEQIYALARTQHVPACALAALDIALWDLHAKMANLPLYEYLALPLPSVPTSVTIGINSPDVVRERIPLLLDGTGVRSLKIKLGSPLGIQADKAMYRQVVKSSESYAVKLRVDANGGWSLEDAQHMMDWLAQRNTDYVEQPLAEGAKREMAILFKNRPLPIFIDESCRFAEDVSEWADRVDGVNIKLMKCGGITGALQIISEAQKFGLQTMIGCMGESSVSIAAAAAISGVIDHIDLDSHLNLAPDPSMGLEIIDGVVTPNQSAGHGAQLKSEFCF